MNTAGIEWAERVAARNAIETAQATKRPELVQMEFLWNQTAAPATPATPETEAAR